MPRPESKTLGYLYDRYVGDDPERIASYEQARADSAVASAIYTLRTEAGLSQRALADRVGTTASVICRLEDADYDGHSLSMLRRVAAALGRRVEVSFPPAAVPEPAATSLPRVAKKGDRTRMAAVSSRRVPRMDSSASKQPTRRAAGKKGPKT